MVAPLSDPEYRLVRLVAARCTDEVLTAFLRSGRGGPSYSGGNSGPGSGFWYEATPAAMSSYTLTGDGDEIVHTPIARLTWARLEGLAAGLPGTTTSHLARLRDQQAVLNRAYWDADEIAQRCIWRIHVHADPDDVEQQEIIARRRAAYRALWHWDIEVVRPAALAHLGPARAVVQLDLFDTAG